MVLSLRLKKSVILLLTAAVTALLLLVGGSTIGSLREIEALWLSHSHEATLHLSEINQIRRHFGYGGFTDSFKNYLLRRDAASRRQSEASLVKLMQSLDEAEKLHLTPLERLAIAEIRTTVEAYREKYLLARVLVDAGQLPHLIEPQVRVDDRAARDAFVLLSDIAIQREQKAEVAAGERIGRAISVILWGTVLFPLVLLVAYLLWRFLHQVVEANSRLERVSSELDAILANAPDAMLGVTEDGAIVRANDQAEQLFGYSTEQLQRMRIEELVPESARERHEDLRRGFMSEGDVNHKAAPGRMLNALKSDGQVIPVEIGLSLVHFGTQVRAIAIIRDVTERLRAQKKIEELNASLKAQNRELEAFSYSVSHDLRTPLRSIEGFSQLVEKRYASRLDSTGVDYLQRIRRATVRMGQLIDDLLQLSRVSRAELRPRYLSFTALAKEVLHNLSESDPERKVKTLLEEGVDGVADPGLIRIVLENLLGNAWKYTAQTASAEIRFGTLNQGGKTVYYVCDNGIGFDMCYADKLFGAFQRLHGVDEFEGTGIGLSTVQRIIHRHSGHVWAEAEPDKGACFYFTLEVVDESVVRPEKGE